MIHGQVAAITGASSGIGRATALHLARGGAKLALVASRHEHCVEIIGPVAQDPSWQSREKAGFNKSMFLVDWEARVVTCPAGKKSISWLPNTYTANGTVFEARFARHDCTPCSSRFQCTRSKQEPRILGLQTREHHEGTAVDASPTGHGRVPLGIRCSRRDREYPCAGGQA